MKNKKDFYAGIISALAVVKLHNADTIHSEIVALCDLNELLAYAKAEGEIEFAGLGEYELQQGDHATDKSDPQFDEDWSGDNDRIGDGLSRFTRG